MHVRVLGTAAGGGLPQWNCACRGCTKARTDPGRRRRHASIAVRAEPGRWFVVNATPDIGDQIEACPPLWPGPGPRETPLAGVVLTDAELDHTLGIARLREAEGVEVYATRAVRYALVSQLRLSDMLGAYTDLIWHELPSERGIAIGSLDAQAVHISGKRPRYAARSDGTGPGSWVVALRIADPATGGSLVYAPALGGWPEELDRAVSAADCVIIDGTFWADEEPRNCAISRRTATEMGHLPIAGPDGTAVRLARAAGRRLYTHLNNTNPLVDPVAPQHKVLAESGIEVATDGMEIDL